MENSTLSPPQILSQSIPPLFLFSTISNVSIGLLGIVGNALVIIVITTNKSLRTPCFKLIAGGSLGSLLTAAYFLGEGIESIGELTGGMLAKERSSLICLLTRGIHGLFGIPFHALITCLVGIDRMIGIVAPKTYRNLGKRYAEKLLVATAGICLIQEVIGFVTSPLTSIVICNSFPSAMDPIFLSTFAGLNLSYTVAIVVIYAAMLICFYYKKSKFKSEASNYNIFMKQQSAVLPTVRMMTLLYFFCGVISEILVNIARNLDSTTYQWADTVLAAGHFLKATSSLVEIASLLISSTKFRQCTKKLLGMKGIPQQTEVGTTRMTGTTKVGGGLAGVMTTRHL